MVMRRSSKILVALGVLLLIVAAALRFVIVPAIFTADTVESTTRLMTIGSVLAPALLAIIGVILVALGIARRRTSTDRPNESTQSTDGIAVADRTTVDPDLWTS